MPRDQRDCPPCFVPAFSTRMRACGLIEPESARGKKLVHDYGDAADIDDGPGEYVARDLDDGILVRIERGEHLTDEGLESRHGLGRLGQEGLEGGIVRS